MAFSENRIDARLIFDISASYVMMYKSELQSTNMSWSKKA